MKRKWIVWTICILVIAVGALLTLWVAIPRQPGDGPTNGQPSRLASGPRPGSAATTVPSVSEPGVLADLDPDVLAMLRNMSIPDDTMVELIEKGFPLISNPRRRALMQTARQSTEEVVADLGNSFVMSDSCNRDVAYSYRDIKRWSRTIPPNVKVLRLIEEGRKDPARIAPLLRQAIRDALSAYDDLIEATKTPIDYDPSKGIQTNDPYYAKHKRYRNRSFEKERVHYVANASFYVLMNIGELDDPKLLAEWFKYKLLGAYSPSMYVWLIDGC